MSDDFKAFEPLFDFIYKGNNQASRLSFKILSVLHTLDDIFDKDKELSDNDIYKFCVDVLFEMSDDPLWEATGMRHHILNTFLRWRDANNIESDPQSTDNDLHKSYMLRAGLYDIFSILAYYLHGAEWAAEVGPTVRRFYGETLEDYIKEMRDA